MIHHINLTYESLISILQGKELCLMYSNPDTPSIYSEVIIHPPFNGVFVTHKELENIKYNCQADILNLLKNTQEPPEYKGKKK